MRAFNVLFLYPNLRGMNMLPPAIALFARILKDHGFNVALFDTTYYETGDSFDSDKAKEKNLSVRPFDMTPQVTLRTTDPAEDLNRLIDSFRPDLIAMSATEDIFPLGLKLLKQVSGRHIPTVAGGVYPTFAAEKVMQHAEIDMVCIGEGEEALLDLCTRMRDGEDCSDIPNLWVRTAGDTVVRNRLRPAKNIDQNPLPDFSLFEEARFYRPMAGKVYRMFPVETHRGCPYACAFCNSPSQQRLYRDEGAGRFFRKKSMDGVRRELEFYKRQWRAEYFYFWADTFFAYSDREFDAFIEMYRDIGIPFWCQTRPETVTEERVNRLRAVGLHRMSVGIEHGNEQFRRKIINRRVSNDTIVRAVEIIAGAALPAGISVNNIVGFPTETRALAMDTIELNRRIATRIDTMNCYAFVPYHGAPLRDVSVRLGYLADQSPTSCLTGEPVLDMPQFPKDEIKGIMKTFSLYVRFDRSRWGEIQQAERNTPNGVAIFERLREEYIQTYFAQ